MKGYGYFKCTNCGKAFRVFMAGVSRYTLQSMVCSCGSKNIVNITYKEYKELSGIPVRSKPKKQKRKKSSRYIPQFHLDDFLKELEEDVSAVIEKHAEAEQKEVEETNGKKKKERKKGSSG